MVHPSSNLEMVATVLALSNNGKFEPNNPGGGETSAAAVCKSVRVVGRAATLCLFSY